MDKRELLIKNLEQAREHMRRVLARADASREIYPHWRAKEVMDHLTGWDDATIGSIKALLNGGEPFVPAARGIDYYNAQTVTERETLNLTHTTREWEVTRQQLIDLIRSLTPAQADQAFIFPWGVEGTVEQVVDVFIEHEEEHAAEIDGILNAAEQDVVK
jgi:hypothetical protein